MVAYSYYPMDQRLRREAEILSARGALVHVICAKNEKERKVESHNGIKIFRVHQQINRRGGFIPYFLRYFLFLCLTTTSLTRLYIKYRYKVIHVHSLPDYLVFCAFFPRLFGVKVILDLRELIPEVFATKFDISLDSKKVHFAMIIEKLSVRYADLVLSTSNKRKDTLRKRTKKKDIAVVLNLPKREIFKEKDMTRFIKENELDGMFIISYAGGLNPERELDVVIRAVKYAKEKIPNIMFIFCGTGERRYIALLYKLIKELDLKKNVLFMGYVPQDEILNYIAISNLALNPYKIHPNLDPLSSTKIFEYLLVPKPVIVPDYPGNRAEFEDLVLFYTSSDYRSLGDKILEVHKNEEHYKQMALKAQEVLFKRYDPKKNEEKLAEIYRNLVFKK